MRRVIPPEVFEHWATCFRKGLVHDDYAEELADVLDLLANNARFEMALAERFHGDNYDGKIH